MRSAKADAVREIAALAQRKWLSFWLIASVIVIVPAAFLRPPAWVLVTRLILLVLLAELLKRNRERSWLALAAGAGLLLTQSLISRSAGLPDWVVPVLADWFHLTLASVWLGGVAMLGVVVRQMSEVRDQTSDNPLVGIRSLSFVVDRFSLVALFCVIGLAMSGIAQAGIFVKGLDELWTTSYGRALSLKVILFGVLIGFGAFHQQVIAPTLRRAIIGRGDPFDSTTFRSGLPRPYDMVARFRVSLLIEAVVGAVLLAAVGILISAVL